MLCDRFELPQGFEAYHKTPVFTEATVPPGLQRAHKTKLGIWGRIVVEEGMIRYHIEALDLQLDLSPGEDGIVIPEVPHHVESLGAVRFSVTFYRATNNVA